LLAGKSLEHTSEYLDPRNPADREALGRDIEETLNTKGPIPVRKPLPPFDPLADDPLEDWWDKLPEATRNQLGARAEEYTSYEDFFYNYMGRGVDFGAFGQIATEWIIKNLNGLISDPKARSDPDYARGGIDHFLGIAKGYLNRLFGIRTAAHRPVENLDRDRGWSKLKYQGRSYEQIAREAHMDEPVVRTAVGRHRERNRDLTLFVANAIWENEHRQT